MLEENLNEGSSQQSKVLEGKALLMVNMSKFVVEIVGTAVLGVFYLLMGDKQAGVLLGYWVVTLFGVAISGAHFNPCVTLVHMFKKNPEKLFRGQRLIGIMYMVA